MSDLFSKVSIFGAFAMAWICGVSAYVLFTDAPPDPPSPWVFVGIGVVWLGAGAWLWWAWRDRRVTR